MIEVVERYLFRFRISSYQFNCFTFYNYYGAKFDILLEISLKKYYLCYELRVFITNWKYTQI